MFENVLLAAQQGAGTRGAASYDAGRVGARRHRPARAKRTGRLASSGSCSASGWSSRERWRPALACCCSTRWPEGLTDPEVVELVDVVRQRARRGNGRDLDRARRPRAGGDRRSADLPRGRALHRRRRSLARCWRVPRFERSSWARRPPRSRSPKPAERRAQSGDRTPSRRGPRDRRDGSPAVLEVRASRSSMGSSAR